MIPEYDRMVDLNKGGFNHRVGPGEVVSFKGLDNNPYFFVIAAEAEYTKPLSFRIVLAEIEDAPLNYVQVNVCQGCGMGLANVRGQGEWFSVFDYNSQDYEWLGQGSPVLCVTGVENKALWHFVSGGKKRVAMITLWADQYHNGTLTVKYEIFDA